jgi:hypothetical protein
VGDVPALRLAPRLPSALRLRVVGMHLHRELLVRKQEFEQQGKALLVASGVAY